jgi:hypothetical protein
MNVYLIVFKLAGLGLGWVGVYGIGIFILMVYGLELLLESMP